MKTKQIHLVVDVPDTEADARELDRITAWLNANDWNPRIIEASEPVAYTGTFGDVHWCANVDVPNITPEQPLYLHSSGDAKDAERYRWIKLNIYDGYNLPGHFYLCDTDTSGWDITIDAAIEASKEK